MGQIPKETEKSEGKTKGGHSENVSFEELAEQQETIDPLKAKAIAFLKEKGIVTNGYGWKVIFSDDREFDIIDLMVEFHKVLEYYSK